ncbi:MAG: Omp28 family outer membrane lipoprotein [Bacteroidetes bacterium]|nr:Omp28 family outer membrane lipoprotein [Bacteroidota bacterium]MBU1719036.1 Omp28 family outer membrane lipoprotein [Bacteroidota bacterium]
MKKNHIHLIVPVVAILSILFAVISFSSCDKIEPPYTEEVHTQQTDSFEIVRKVFLEDYTGHKCVNCPGGAQTAHDLEAIYGEKLVILAIHAGYFATPDASGMYTTDFRTATGTELDNYFGVGNVGNPNGMVNRKEFSGNRIVGPSDWGSKIAEIIDLPADAFIKMENSYNSGSRSLTSTLKNYILTDLTGDYRLCVYLSEDSIVAAQKNNDPAIGTTPDIVDYTHMHVMRAAINSTWGDTLVSGSALNGTIIEKTFQYTLPANFNASLCSVVAFIYNDQTKEIIQAEKMKVVE